MQDFLFQLVNGSEVVETEKEPLETLDEAAELARKIAEELRSEGWVDDEEPVQLAVLDDAGLELFRLRVS